MGFAYNARERGMIFVNSFFLSRAALSIAFFSVIERRDDQKEIVPRVQV